MGEREIDPKSRRKEGPASLLRMLCGGGGVAKDDEMRENVRGRWKENRRLRDGMKVIEGMNDDPKSALQKR